MFWRAIFVLLLTLVPFSPISGDEETRQIQESLRNRNLYHGDIDGRMNATLNAALKRFQERKGFPVTGQVDDDTARSLGIARPGLGAGGQGWPDVPVLRSDVAVQAGTAPETVALQETGGGRLQNPDPPAELPAAGTSFPESAAAALVRDYLKAAETDDVSAQTRYYADAVTYFDHGEVNRKFVTRDTGNYVKRWPKRKYSLEEPVTFSPGPPGHDSAIEFTISFTVENPRHTVSGRTRNFWVIRNEGGDFKIVSIREERLRD